MSKRSKKEYEETFNKIFGVNIKWSKLSLSDLETLAEALVDKNEELCRNMCKPSTSLVTLIDKVIPEEEQGPFIRILKGLLKG